MFTVNFNRTVQAPILIGAIVRIRVICFIGLISTTGCKTDGAKQETCTASFDNGVNATKLSKNDGLNNSCGSRCNGKAAIKQLIERLNNGSSIQMLRTWCMERLAEPSDVPSGVVRVLETAPESLQIGDPDHGSASISVWHDPSEIGPSVMFSWHCPSGDSWGLIISKPEFQPTASWLNCQKLQPGVFAFFSSHERKSTK